MKKTVLAIFIALFFAAAEAQTVQQTLYFDFGSITTNQGETTDGADANGNYWNNITNNTAGKKYAASGTEYTGIVNSKNEATALKVTLNSRFSTNGCSGGGGLLSPSADLLGDLAVKTATEDYFFIEKSEDNSSFSITGLDPTLAYKFYVFASRSATQTRTGTYTAEGYNTATIELQAAGKDLGGSGVNQNNSTIATTDYVFPDNTGCIKFTVSRKTGDYIPLNILKIEEYTGVVKPVSYVAVAVTGSAVGTTPVAMTNVKGQQFEAWLHMAEGTFSLQATTDDQQTVTFGQGGSDGTLTAGGTAITTADAPCRLTVDLDAKTYTLTPITSLALVGSVTSGGWSLSGGTSMDYQGNMVWQFSGQLTGKDTNSDPARFNFVMNKSWSTTLKRIGRTDSISLSGANDIYLNPGSYIITADLGHGTFKVENGLSDLDPLRITVMGSSVANGVGATPTGEGYAYLYGQQLATRYAGGMSDNNFFISNISVNGNSTVNLLERYDELQRDFGKYVVYGVSLGNEGLHGATDQQAIYNQFKTNMATLIGKARADGKTPVVMNNYTRGDFTSADYEYVKQMDQEIETWDVPSVDLLGAIDNGAGQWADGYMALSSSGDGYDVYHPNSAGHQEMMRAIVPSMFDALASGKTLTMQRVKNSNFTMQVADNVTFVPEDSAHAFSLMLTFATTTATAHIATVTTTTGDAQLDLAGGALQLTLPDGATLTAGSSLADGQMHTLLVSHHYAQGAIALTADDSITTVTKQATDLKLAPTRVVVGGNPTVVPLTLGEMMFYRSAKIATSDLLGGSDLHKSSLELYVPFNSTQKLQSNLAMSLNNLSLDITTGLTNRGIAHDDALSAWGTRGAIVVSSASPASVSVYNILGTLVAKTSVTGRTVISGLTKGVYMVNNQKVVVR